MQNRHFEDPFLSILPKLDLHGETTDMVEYLVKDFITLNRKMNKLKIQIIHGRHGKRLKERVKEVLKKSDEVSKFYIYGFNDGLTIVELKPIDKKN